MPPASRPRRLALAAVLGAVLLGTGCTATVAGTPASDPAPAPTEGPGSDPVLWVDRVCGSLLTFTGPALAQPQFGDTPDLPGIKQKLTDYLNGIVTGLQQSRTQLGEVGRSPVGGGDEAVARIGDVLTKLETDITAAKAKVDSADPDDPAGLPRHDHRRREPARADQCAGRARRPQRVAPAAEGRGQGGELPAALGAGQRPAGLIGAPGYPSSNACSTVRPVSPVSQLSLFSAGARPPRPGDLAGLLCGPGQIVRFGSGDTARLSVVLADPRRAPVVVAACAAVGIDAEQAVTESGASVVRTAFRRDLVGLAQAWTLDGGRRPGPVVERKPMNPLPRPRPSGNREDRAAGNAARRARVASVDGRGRSLGRPRGRSAAGPARPADPPRAHRGSDARRDFPGPQRAGDRTTDHRRPADPAPHGAARPGTGRYCSGRVAGGGGATHG